LTFEPWVRADSRAVQLALTVRGLEVVRAGDATVRALNEERLPPLGGHDSSRSAALQEMLLTLLRQSEAREDARHPSGAALALPVAAARSRSASCHVDHHRLGSAAARRRPPLDVAIDVCSPRRRIPTREYMDGVT
jgi:hypothetical protein